MVVVQTERSFGLWAKAWGFLLTVVLVGFIIFVLVYKAIFGPAAVASFTPRQTAVYLCRSKFEREVPNAFLAAKPASTVGADGFDVSLKGTSTGAPIGVRCEVRGNQVTAFVAD